MRRRRGFFDQPKGPIHSESNVYAGEKKLMVAILRDALDCYRKNLENRTSYGQRILKETEAWFHHDDFEYLYSFRNICDWLDFDHRLIRNELDKMKGPEMRV